MCFRYRCPDISFLPDKKTLFRIKREVKRRRQVWYNYNAMVVYIEYVVIDNVVIDGLLLSLVQKCFHRKRNKPRIFLASLFGAATACVFPLLSLSFVPAIALKLLCGFVMSLLSCRCESVRQYISNYLLLLLLTFLSGGAVYAVCHAFGVSFDLLSGAYGGEVCLGGLLAFVYLLSRAIGKVAMSLYRKKTIFPFLRDCEVVIGEMSFSVKGFIDSGNTLFDRKSGLPVILASPELSVRLRTSGALAGKRASEMYFSTVSGKDCVPVYVLEKLKIYCEEETNIIYNVAIGLSEKPFCNGGEYDLLLNPAATREERKVV